MIKSMTGYGKGQGAVEGVTLNVEIKSVNHRYCDMTVKAPRSLMPFENEIKKTVGKRLKRGKIDLFINQETSCGGSTVPMMNQPLAKAYMAVFDQMRSEFGLSGEVPLSLLAAQRDVVVLQESEVSEASLRQCLEVALGSAIDAIEKMRAVEGEATRQDILARLEVAVQLLARVEARAPMVSQEWKGKLEDRIARLCKDVEFDPQRLAQEVAVFADRCDISEEIVRFKSHLQQFQSLLDSAEPVGRQMDFLVQELNREVNTIGSKSNDAELTATVVEIKAELEKVREQVQNVE